MKVNSLASKQATAAMLVNVPRLITGFYSGRSDFSEPTQWVVFATSGHRGSVFENSFNEGHVLPISQAISL